MLSGVAARRRGIGEVAQRRAISDGAARLQAAFPEAVVQAGSDAIVLTGRIDPEDVRLRWIGSVLT